MSVSCVFFAFLTFFLLADLTKQLELVRCSLDDLQGCHEASLSSAALAAVAVVRPEGLLLPDRLHALSARVRQAVLLGAHRGAACALGLVQLRFGMDPLEVSLEFPAGISQPSEPASPNSVDGSNRGRHGDRGGRRRRAPAGRRPSPRWRLGLSALS
jgi:hypothetical protein